VPGDSGWLDPAKLLVFAAFVLPGFIAWKAGQLRRPQGEQKPQDAVLEIVGYGVANALFATLLRMPPTKWTAWPTDGPKAIELFVSVFALPAILSSITGWLLESMATAGLLVSGFPTAWDRLVSGILRKRLSLVVITLRDGRKVGGAFSKTAFASNYPYERDILIGEVWQIDQATGAFVKMIDGQTGLYMRGDDALTLEVFDATTVIGTIGKANG
jgi:hypothetical protein